MDFPCPLFYDKERITLDFQAFWIGKSEADCGEIKKWIDRIEGGER